MFHPTMYSYSTLTDIVSQGLLLVISNVLKMYTGVLLTFLVFSSANDYLISKNVSSTFFIRLV